jgi:hypothetical protein
MPWNKVVEFGDPLACRAALQFTIPAEILPTARGSFYAEATQIGMNALRPQRFREPRSSIVRFRPDLLKKPHKIVGHLVALLRCHNRYIDLD